MQSMKTENGGIAPLIPNLCKSANYIPWRRVLEWRYGSNHSWTRYHLEASGQLRITAALLPEKVAPLLVEEEVGSKQRPVWTLWWRKIYLASFGNRNMIPGLFCLQPATCSLSWLSYLFPFLRVAVFS